MSDEVLTVEGATPPKSASVHRVAAAQLAGGAVDVDAYAADSDSKAVEGDSLAALQSLAEELIVSARNILVAKRTLADAEAAYSAVAEKKLPDLMEKHNLPKFEFFDRTTGLTLIIKLESDKWRVALPPVNGPNASPDNGEKRKNIYGWLREIGQGGSLKKIIEVQAGLLDDDKVAEVVAGIQATHPELDIATVENIAPATLTALVNRLLKDGKTVHDALNVQPIREAKVAKK